MKNFIIGVFAVVFASNAYAHCEGRVPLTDAQVKANYQWVEKELHESPAQLAKDWQKVKKDFASTNAFLAYLRHYASLPESSYLTDMRNYRREYNSCGKGGGCGGGHGLVPRPVFDCSSNNQCSSNEQCISNQCQIIGYSEARCDYSSNLCPSGSSCDSGSGLCK